MKDQYSDVMSKTSVPEFIAKIYSILEKNEFQDIISWSQNCSEIHIKNPKALQDEVLPIYFRHRKIESFIRQLNMYRFSKVNKLNKEKNHMFFKNQLFKKGNIDALSLIKRKKKGLVEDTTDASDDNEAESLENYKEFVKENVFLIQEELLKIRKNHPEVNHELVKILQYSNLIVGQDLNHNVLMTIPEIKTRHNFFQTYKEIFQLTSIHHFNSKCSIEGEINQTDFN